MEGGGGGEAAPSRWGTCGDESSVLGHVEDETEDDRKSSYKQTVSRRQNDSANQKSE